MKVWEVETIISLSNQEATEKAIVEVRSNIVLKDRRYWVKMPWIDTGVDPNFTQVLGRLNRLLDSLERDSLFEQYDGEIQKLIADGHIEQVYDDNRTNGCYLAHRCVIKTQSKTTKMRIVFDASGNRKGKKSLNDCPTHYWLRLSRASEWDRVAS
jgi:hypothetical protein